MAVCSRPDTWCSSSSDEDMETLVSHATFKNEGEFTINEECREKGSLEDESSCTEQDIPSSKPWAPPEGLWRVTSSETLLFNGDDVPLETYNQIQEEIRRSDSSAVRSSGLVPTGGKQGWMESLGSMCSSGSSLSLAERVEMNRNILKQMLQKAQVKNSEGPQAGITDTQSRGEQNDSEWHSGVSLPDCEQTQRFFVSGIELPPSPRHQHMKRLLERARMKARSNPLKADHTILPIQRDKPELSHWVGSPVQLGTDRVVGGSGNLSDSSSSDSTGGSRRRRIHGQSPTRVRFQDESEKDAEVRYLERQRRRAGERAHGLLGPKPCLASYVNGQHPEDSEFQKYKNRRSQQNLAKDHSLHKACTWGRQCNTCETIDDRTISGPLKTSVRGEAEGKTVPCWIAPTLPNQLVRIEQIKETYIGGMSPVIVESDGIHCYSLENGGGTLPKMRRSRKGENSLEVGTVAAGRTAPGSPSFDRLIPTGFRVHLSNGDTNLPLNPYTPDLLMDRSSRSSLLLPSKEAPKMQPDGAHPQPFLPPPQTQITPLRLGRNSYSIDQQEVKPVTSHYNHEDCKQSKLESTPQTSPFQLRTSKNANMMTESGYSNVHQGSQQAGVDQEQIRLEVTSGDVENPNEPTNDVQTQKQQRESNSIPSLTMPSEVERKEGRAHQALRRLFSAMGLNSGRQLEKTHCSSVEQLSPQTPGPPNTLKKAPSLQSLRLGSPFAQLKKSSSMQNLQSVKRKSERSTAYSPGARPCSPALSRNLHRTLSVEDVGNPSAMRSVGRVVRAFSDGTYLLELYRPPAGSFGFLISRGKGRVDSGVYVEEMGDSSTQKLYAGLLGVGDEILEVNGEKVAGLSLDLVTELMIQKSTASVRVLRQRLPHR